MNVTNNKIDENLSSEKNETILKPGDGVFVKWGNGVIYKGEIKRKLKKNWEVMITDGKWHYSTNLASIPGWALIRSSI